MLVINRNGKNVPKCTVKEALAKGRKLMKNEEESLILTFPWNILHNYFYKLLPLFVVGTIQFWRGWVIYLIFVWEVAWFFFKKRRGGSTNERPGSDHVIWGPTRGLENKMTTQLHCGLVFPNIYFLLVFTL